MILLIGNILSAHGLNPTAIEDLSKKLSSHYTIKSTSNKKNKLFRIFDMLFSITFNFRKCQLVILDVFGMNAFYYSIIAILYLKLLNIKIIPVFRGGSLPETMIKNPYLFNFVFSGIEPIVCPSSYLANIFKKKFEVLIINNYIELSNYPYLLREIVCPRLLWVRSIHSIYNPIMAIRVLNLLCNIYPKSELCIVGPNKDDSIQDVKKLISQLNLKKNIKITGQLEKKEWLKLSQDYNVFINTTNYDNMPVTILEAMALGLPVVSTNAGGIPSLIQHNINGKLVEKNDDFSMVSHIIDYLNNKKQRKEICNNARYMIENKYSSNIVIPKWTTFIDDIKDR